MWLMFTAHTPLLFRWCIKEAAYKACSGIFPFPLPTLRSFVLSHDSTGRPILDIQHPALEESSGSLIGGYLNVHTEPGRSSGRFRLLPSISHDAGIVTAIVIAGLEDDVVSDWTESRYGMDTMEPVSSH